MPRNVSSCAFGSRKTRYCAAFFLSFLCTASARGLRHTSARLFSFFFVNGIITRRRHSKTGVTRNDECNSSGQFRLKF